MARIKIILDGFTAGTVEASPGLVTSVGTVVRANPKTIKTDKPSFYIHGSYFAHEAKIEYGPEVEANPTFAPGCFLSQRQADEFRSRCGGDVKQICHYYGIRAATARMILARFPAAA